jgi:DnaJ-class molecular chaperone
MNYYQILQIEPGASLRDIKKAYRRLALQYHPDKNNNNTESTERFKDISIAYQVLSDPIQRSYYDHTGSADIDFDLVSSMEMFTFFFKDYDPKLLSIIEKTYGRIREELQDNQTDSLLRIIYNIEQ